MVYTMFPEAITYVSNLSPDEACAFAQSPAWCGDITHVISVDVHDFAPRSLYGCMGCGEAHTTYLAHYIVSYGDALFSPICAKCRETTHLSLNLIKTMFVADKLGQQILAFKQLSIILMICHATYSSIVIVTEDIHETCAWCSKNGTRMAQVCFDHGSDFSFFGVCGTCVNMLFDIVQENETTSSAHMDQIVQRLMLMRAWGLNKDVLGLLVVVMRVTWSRSKCSGLINRFVKSEAS